jgi:glutaryl-CoA dehydrogenase
MNKDSLGFSYPRLDEEIPSYAKQILEGQNGLTKWINSSFMDLITDCYLDGRFPMELLPEMAERGLLGIKTDPKYGGHGADNYTYGVICRELERGDSGLRSFVSVQNSLVMYPIEQFGNEEQKKRWLPLLASGKAIGAFGLTGPEGGSDPANMNTFYRRDGGDYIINGSKQFITNGSIANVIVVWAIDEEDVMRGFLLEPNMRGVETHEMKGKLSLRASNTSEIFLDDVRVPAESMLPGAKNIGAALSCLNEARFGIAWGAIGSASFCAEKALEHVNGRVLFGGKLAGKQLIQQKLAWLDREINSAQLRVLHLTKIKEAGTIQPRDISEAKQANVNMACEATRLARRMLGASGIMAESHVMRHMCNMESLFTYEGTDDIHTLIIGRAITDISAF